MSDSPMLSIKEATSKPKVTANLLPCRIHHDGPIDPATPYWKPQEAEDSTKVSYFRGRKLQGKVVPLPNNYKGVVMERAADELKKEMQPPNGLEDDDLVPLENVGTMQATAEFDEMVVWSHESVATAAADPYVRCMEEWLQVADKIHSYDDASTAAQK
ncbi:MCM DNA helicase complex subunit mcm6 [Lecanicillium sp. MT-2017a]|nr:MCM DNA helicase complex subunit mcm6 [Lecanicillium sp. MT-2017a]